MPSTVTSYEQVAGAVSHGGGIKRENNATPRDVDPSTFLKVAANSFLEPQTHISIFTCVHV